MQREQNTNNQVFAYQGLVTDSDFTGTQGALTELVNAYVDETGKIQRRTGIAGEQNLVGASVGSDSSMYRFKFSGYEWTLQKSAGTVAISRAWQGFFDTHSVKGSIFANEGEPTYATINDDDLCYVLIATKNNPLIIMALLEETLTVSTQVSTTHTLVSKRSWVGNPLSITNTKLYNASDNSIIPATSVLGSGATITVTTTGIPYPVGTKLRMISCFWLRACDANFYSGDQLSQVAYRRNVVPLDVNVKTPLSLITRPILNEESLRIFKQRLLIYQNNAVNNSVLFRATNPTSATTWTPTDGSFEPGKTPKSSGNEEAYMGFGALETNNKISALTVCAYRDVLLTGGRYPVAVDVKCYVDAVEDTNVTFTGSNFTSSIPYNSSSLTPTRFVFASNSSRAPGVPENAVIELIYVNAVGIGSGAQFEPVRLFRNENTVTIGDGMCLPLYGYNIFADTKNGKFPDIVTTHGNRVALASSESNFVVFSSANFDYRGITWNNFQVSTKDFDAQSPFILYIDNVSSVNNLVSTSNYFVATTDNGVYRVQADEATNALATRISTERFNKFSLVVAKGEVFGVNINGIFVVTFSNERQQTSLDKISQPVDSLFKDLLRKQTVNIGNSFYNPVQGIAYVPALDSIVWMWERGLNAMFIPNRTFYQIPLEVNVGINPGWVGFYCNYSGQSLHGFAFQTLRDVDWEPQIVEFFTNSPTIPFTGNDQAQSPNLRESIYSLVNGLSGNPYVKITNGIPYSNPAVTKTYLPDLSNPYASVFCTTLSSQDNLVKTARTRSLYVVIDALDFDYYVGQQPLTFTLLMNPYDSDDQRVQKFTTTIEYSSTGVVANIVSDDYTRVIDLTGQSGSTYIIEMPLQGISSQWQLVGIWRTKLISFVSSYIDVSGKGRGRLRG